MKKTVRTRSVLPVYAIAAVWLFCTFVLRFRGLGGCIKMAVLSGVVFFITHSLFPDKVEEVEIPIPQPEPEPVDPEIAALQAERDRAIGEMRRLNESIRDETISGQIDRIEATTEKIFDCVLSKPEKKSDIRTFLNYYLPTTIRLLNEYDRMDNLGASGDNIDRSKQRIAQLLEKVCEAFSRQLDALFQNDAMDIAAEAAVMEQMIRQQGLDEEPMQGMELGGQL